MMMFDVDRVVLNKMNEDGTYRATSKTGSQIYDRCYFSRENPSNVCQEKMGRSALMLSIDNQNFILGYYEDDHEAPEYKIYVEGEQFLRAGESKAITLGDDGTIGIYDIAREDDGSITKTPKLVYEADDKLYVAFSELLSTMSDASISTRVWQDAIGMNHVSNIFKGRGDDAGPRLAANIDGSITGVEASLSIDLSPGAKRAVPTVGIPMLPKSLSINTSSLLPLQIMYALASIPNVLIKIDSTGNLTIATGPNGSGSTIVLNQTPPNAVEIYNIGKTGSIVISQTGQVVISGIAGVEVKGAGTGLLETLSAFLTDYIGHTHPSAMGPTAVPTPPSGVETIAKLKVIKGSAS